MSSHVVPPADPGASGERASVVSGLPAAVVTGTGSMPGVEPRVAARAVSYTLAVDGGVPFVVELPDRGPGAEMIGRGLQRLAGQWSVWGADTTPQGWVVNGTSTSALRRAGSFWSEDLDVTEEVYDGWAGPMAISLVGPYTLAANVERYGRPLLADHGAVRDLVSTWAEAAQALVDDLGRRLPHAQVFLTADEPGLPAVLGGTVPTASGMATHRALELSLVRDGLTSVARVAGGLAIHCCAPDPPLRLLREAGFTAVGVDLSLAYDVEELGAVHESGIRVMCGVLGNAVEPARAARVIRELGSRIGFVPQTWVEGVGLTPPCGLAGLAPHEATTVLADGLVARTRLLEEVYG